MDAALLTMALLMVEFLVLAFSGRRGPTGMLLSAEQILELLHYGWAAFVGLALAVVDAGTGQNALNQAVEFHNAVGLTAITLTKLDGTAKGGIVFAIADRVGVPIRFIGIGEKVDDLREFNAAQFVHALFDDELQDTGGSAG